MTKKICIISLGCPKNLVDSEIMLGLLGKKGYEITSEKSQAEVIIVNTCAFIESAVQESINSILEASKYKEERCELLIVAGCLSQRYKGQILEEIPEVDAVIGTGCYEKILDIIEKAYQCNIHKIVKPVLCDIPDDIKYLENERVISTTEGYCYVKIAEGCDNFCSYCIIPQLRGSYRSRKIEQIINEVKFIAQKGIKEIVLVAQDTTRYGIDIYGNSRLIDLIREISNIEGISWIRLLYCYPERISENLIDEIANNEKICKYLDIPIQHISNKVLKSMGRRGSSEDIKGLLQKLRKRIPGITIRTSLIVGFPGEEEEDFKELYDFVKDFEFDRLGVFTYFREEGTPAAKLKNQVPENIKVDRYNKIMELQKEIVEKKNLYRLNQNYKVLIEGVSDDGIFYYGRSYAEAPEIDGKVYFTSKNPLRLGNFANVKILNIQDYDLIGEVEYEYT